MVKGTFSDKFGFLDRSKRLRKQDYRQRLGHADVLEEEEGGTLGCALGLADEIRTLGGSLGTTSTSVQAVIVSAVQSLERVYVAERQAAAAAISLGQREMMNDMVGATAAMLEACHELLSAQGNQLLDLCAAHEIDAQQGSWWFAISETLARLEDGVERLTSVVSAQPKGGAARRLSCLVIRLMRAHRNALLAEADHWIS